MKKYIFHIFLFYGCLIFAAEPAGWQTLLHCRKAEGNLQFQMPWGSGANPAVFMLRGKDDDKAFRISLGAGGMKAEIADSSGRISPVRRPVIHYPVDFNGTAQIVFKIRDNEWSVFVNGELFARMPSLTGMPGDVLWPKRSGIALTEPMRFLPVPKPSFKTDFMIEPGAPNELYPWTVRQGNWHIHTARQQSEIRPETDQKRTKEAPPTADKSPNFYSIKGSGNNAESIITTGYDFYDNYSLQGSLQLDNGEAGLVFHHRDHQKQETAEDSTADFYALTIRMDTPFPGNRDIRLWKQVNGTRETLAKAQIPLFLAQWHLPSVKIHGDEIICLMDNYPVFRVREKLPPGGKIGLYAKTQDEIRFDDITLESCSRQNLDTPESLQFNLLARSKGFSGIPALPEWKPGIAENDNPLTISAAAPKHPEMMTIGNPRSTSTCFSAEITSLTGEAGIICAWTAQDRPCFLFTAQISDGMRLLKLQELQPDGSLKLLDKYQLPGNDSRPLQLMTDMTEQGKLRCCLDGVLIFMLEHSTPPGAAGLHLAKGAKAVFSNLKLADKREIVKELEQKNPVFKQDSFMRHWASPEGQWINGGNGKLWHKGDFFGDFSIRIPMISKGELHVAVPDGGDEGALVLTIDNGTTALIFKEPGKDDIRQEIKTDKPGILELVREGTWLWLHTPGGTLEMRIPGNLKNRGTRVLAKNFTLADMAKSKVTRTNVIDEYFNESPFNWICNGGDWQIINRFQCTPSWSHMIGEAPGGLGAFWRKQIFTGDMTLEFYAGTRQNFYDKAGNLNCTIMAADTTASSGYTAACTEWDHGGTQNQTTLYKNGLPLAKTDAYLVPRRRNGMYRRILNPLVAQGRPIHGAWFYIKLRKIGNKLEYWFDDELIFSQTDGAPLRQGLLGIWTFVHSMTLAQVKITYDHAEPRPFPVKILPTQDTAPAPRQKTQFLSALNGFPLDSMSPNLWTYFDDKVGQATLDFIPGGFIFKNGLGGGLMRTDNKLPATPLNTTAGWRFQIKRSKDAHFNLIYWTGTQKGGEIKRTRDYFHKITGPDFSGGKYAMSGKTSIPPVENIDGSEEGWQTVTVYIPPFVRAAANGENPVVKLLGFGIQELDEAANGICGNGPAAAYAIRNLRPVFFNAPALTSAEGETAALVLPTGTAEPFNDFPKEDFGENTAILRLAKADAELDTHVHWIKLPPKMAYTLNWNTKIPDSLIMTLDRDYMDPRQTSLKLEIGGHPMKLIREHGGRILAHLPRTPEFSAMIQSGTLPVTVKYSDITEVVNIPVKSTFRLNEAPVLTGIQGASPFCLTFENGLATSLADTDPKRISYRERDIEQGGHLLVQNRAYRQALKHSYKTGFSMAKYPIAQFRYKAAGMAQISMILDNTHIGKISEKHSGRAAPLRLGHQLVEDNSWHTWTGFATDAFKQNQFTPKRFIPATLTLKSAEHNDQTGACASLELDDFVFGPAVNSPEQLTFTPVYFDHDGVAEVQAAVIAGDKDAHSRTPAELAALDWHAFKPGEQIKLPLPENAADGVSHIAIRATDTLGTVSDIFDLPFLLDRKAPQTSWDIRESKEPLDNGTRMIISFAGGGGAPLLLENTEFLINGKQQPLPPWTSRLAHSPQDDILSLNHPFIFRKLLDDAKDGDSFTLEVQNIQDGAGNKAPNLTSTFKVNYAADKTGPSWFKMEQPPSVLFFCNWDGQASASTKFTRGNHNGLQIVNQLGTSPHLLTRSHYSAGDLTLKVNWKPADFPWISFRAMTSTIRDSADIKLVLTDAAGKTRTVSLRRPGNADNELNKTQSFKWVNNVPEFFAFNIREMLLESGMKEEELKSLEFKHINFQRRGLHHEDTLFLDDFFIHAAATGEDVMKWTAYDASGVASLECTALDKDGKDTWTHSFQHGSKMDLAVLRAKITSPGLTWFRCQAKDKPGNLSTPFYLPVVK